MPTNIRCRKASSPSSIEPGVHRDPVADVRPGEIPLSRALQGSRLTGQIDSASGSSGPVLSPIASTSTPTLSSSVTSRFVIGV